MTIKSKFFHSYSSAIRLTPCLTAIVQLMEIAFEQLMKMSETSSPFPRLPCGQGEMLKC